VWQLSTQRQASHSQEVLGRPVSGGVGGECGKPLQSHHRPSCAQRRGQPCTTRQQPGLPQGRFALGRRSHPPEVVALGRSFLSHKTP
jgi:hypothetical protein